MSTVLVCGSREWTDQAAIQRELLALTGYSVLIHGAARGADRIAAEIGDRLGFVVQAFPAEWERLGKKAGPQRNHRMLTEGKPDLVLAFPLPGSKGTWDMVKRAADQGVRVVVCSG